MGGEAQPGRSRRRWQELLLTMFWRMSSQQQLLWIIRFLYISIPSDPRSSQTAASFPKRLDLFLLRHPSHRPSPTLQKIWRCSLLIFFILFGRRVFRLCSATDVWQLCGCFSDPEGWSWRGDEGVWIWCSVYFESERRSEGRKRLLEGTCFPLVWRNASQLFSESFSSVQTSKSQ